MTVQTTGTEPRRAAATSRFVRLDLGGQIGAGRERGLGEAAGEVHDDEGRARPAGDGAAEAGAVVGGVGLGAVQARFSGHAATP